jgi:spoIIIJ-associated protein
MEWVETTAETIELAKSLALDQLGVAEDDAEFEVVEEPKQGLFGRTRGEARVRARVRPNTPRGKNERRDRGPKRAPRAAGEGSNSRRGPKSGSDRPKREPRPPREKRAPRTDMPPVDPATVSVAATTFLNGLLAAASLTGSAQATVAGEDIDINVTGDEVAMFVGAKGATLMAIQDLTRVVSQRRLGDHETHLRVDIAGYREKRREALSRFAHKVAADVVASGQPRVLEPMNSADRKIVHDSLVEVAGVETRSQGQDPHRRVVVAVAGSDSESDD